MSQDRGPRLGPTRAEVLHHLRTAGGPVPVSEVSAAVGLHPNTTRFHLDALTELGLVVRQAEQRHRPGRPKVMYRAADGHRANGYQDLAAAMVKHFAAGLEERGARAITAGEAWGAELRGNAAPQEDSLARVVTTMQGLGYEPELVGGDEPVLELSRCPYLDLADDDPEVVCKLHLGLIKGLLGPDQPWAVSAIVPFAAPSKCLVRLAPSRPAARADA